MAREKFFKPVVHTTSFIDEEYAREDVANAEDEEINPLFSKQTKQWYVENTLLHAEINPEILRIEKEIDEIHNKLMKEQQEAIQKYESNKRDCCKVM